MGKFLKMDIKIRKFENFLFFNIRKYLKIILKMIKYHKMLCRLNHLKIISLLKNIFLVLNPNSYYHNLSQLGISPTSRSMNTRSLKTKNKKFPYYTGLVQKSYFWFKRTYKRPTDSPNRNFKGVTSFLTKQDGTFLIFAW